LQATVLRVAAHPRMHKPVLICADDHRFIVAEQLREIGAAADTIVLEPVARNTAPATIVAALMAARRKALALILPSDQSMESGAPFAEAIASAATIADLGFIVLFGILPKHAETGYGYIRRGDRVGNGFRIEKFIEKPELERATEMAADPSYFWNSGMLMFDPEAFLREARRLEPEMVTAAQAALDAAHEDMDFLRLATEPYQSIVGKSVDYAILERAEHAAVVPLNVAWSDLGSWAALWSIGKKDALGTVKQGDVVAIDTTNSYLQGDGILVATIGLDRIVAVGTRDAVLIGSIDQSQRVREIADRLQSDRRTEILSFRRVHRPWGWYETVDEGKNFLVKRLMVSPGASLSLQMHHHRSEHWVVVQGMAEVRRGDDVFRLSESESTFIPVGVKHRLANPGDIPLHLIEVQSGSYLSEDDIVRFEDNYGRIASKMKEGGRG